MTTWKVNSKYQKIGDGVWTCVGIHNGVPLMLHANGRDLHNIGDKTYFEQMFWEHKEPITVEGWVVIKSNGATFFASEKRIAQCYVDSDERATIVHVKGTVGVEP